MKKWLMICGILLLLLAAGCFFYIKDYYPAEEGALQALESWGTVKVSQTACGWCFDGPSEDTALIFYPGGKVEETAYAPFARELAEEGTDVFLLKVPARLAILGTDKADLVLAPEAYEHWYVGGHSLGGVAAASYAAEHPDKLQGVVLCAAYPTKQLDENLIEILIYGSCDQVVNKDKLEEAKEYAPQQVFEYEIPGGNHAGFGCYGPQKGDGQGTLSAKEQQELAAEYIVNAMETGR